MFFTLLVAATAALIWAITPLAMGAGSRYFPHDPTSLELAAMAAVTLATYSWVKRTRMRRSETAFPAANAPFPPSMDAPHFAIRGTGVQDAKEAEHAA